MPKNEEEKEEFQQIVVGEAEQGFIKADVLSQHKHTGTDYPKVSFTDLKNKQTIYFEEYANTASGVNTSINWNNSQKQRLTLNVSTSISFVNPPNAGHYSLMLVQGASTTGLVVWNTPVKWAGGVASSLSATINSVDIATFYYDGNSNFYGDIITDFR